MNAAKISEAARTTPVILCGALVLLAASQARAATPISTCGAMITKSGSYLLTRNLTVKNGNCILIDASYVTLDLGGFTIACTGPAAGISFEFPPKPRGAIIRNGIVVGCSQGVKFDSGALVERISTLSGGVEGINVAAGNLLIDSVVTGNTNGVSLGCPSNAIDNMVVGNSGGSITTTGGCDLFNNLVP